MQAHRAGPQHTRRYDLNTVDSASHFRTCHFLLMQHVSVEIIMLQASNNLKLVSYCLQEAHRAKHGRRARQLGACSGHCAEQYVHGARHHCGMLGSCCAIFEITSHQVTITAQQSSCTALFFHPAGTISKGCQHGSELHSVCPHCSSLWAVCHAPLGDRVSLFPLPA